MPHPREATSDDAALLARLLRESFEEYRGRLEPPSSAHGKTEEAVRRELEDGGALVAEADTGDPVGCVFFHVKPDHVYLDRLAVLPAHRGQGLARRLVDAVEARARAAGRDRVRLCVRLVLTDHHVWYGRLGYQLHSRGTHPGFLAPTFLVLEKHL
ncbi:GNAT family N-acetyltransferase [Myxococcus sp. K38C18041901]|uniref:GNAT family N-acetyltransferase n=1 Tax=Myxococcus guangdongensis TaxID=2906760 RepID=UPI0020A76BC6|nr:GNAT family N-acetyltransferase [Myxococcus guangdongensis]MCP3060896.1 GNAT family N-acetyltransferase [Myxococcus guangdongensis]